MKQSIISQPPFDFLKQNGYLSEMIPIVPIGASIKPASSLKENLLGKIPGQYFPMTKSWGGIPWLKIQPTQQDLENWKTWPEVGIGLRTGNFVGVDIDVLDPVLAARIEAEFILECGSAPCRIGNAPKRLLLYIQNNIPRGKVTLEFKGKKSGKIEILGKGNQFVAYGIHPTTKNPYFWGNENPANVSAEELPLITHEEIDKTLLAIKKLLIKEGYEVSIGKKALEAADKKRTTLKTQYLDQEHTVKRAIDYLENNAPEAIEGENGDKTTFMVACNLANFGLSEDKIFELMAEYWNEQKAFPSWDIDELRLKVANAIQYNNEGIGSKHPSSIFEPIKTADISKRRLEPIKWEDFSKLPKQNPLIRGLLDRSTMSIICGDSHTGKSFLALDLGIHIAAGISWRGRKTHQGSVVYIAAEGGMGITKRLRASYEFHDLKSFPPLSVIPCHIDLCHNDIDTEEIIREIKNIDNVELIVIDTLSRALSGGDENGPRDMGAFITNCEKIKQATGAHVMIIHHTGKEMARGPRGHNSLRAAVDTEVSVTKNRSIITAEIKKQRDGETDERFSSELVILTIGEDDEAKPIQSCVLRPIFTPIIQQPVISGTNEKALRIIQETMDRIGMLRKIDNDKSFKCLTKKQCKEALRDGRISNAAQSDDIERRIRKIIKDLISAKVIDASADFIWLTEDPDKSGFPP